MWTNQRALDASMRLPLTTAKPGCGSNPPASTKSRCQNLSRIPVLGGRPGPARREVGAPVPGQPGGLGPAGIRVGYREVAESVGIVADQRLDLGVPDC